jgi:hypothetical protein
MLNGTVREHNAEQALQDPEQHYLMQGLRHAAQYGFDGGTETRNTRLMPNRPERKPAGGVMIVGCTASRSDADQVA